jgi:hypothetical protein
MLSASPWKCKKLIPSQWQPVRHPEKAMSKTTWKRQATSELRAYTLGPSCVLPLAQLVVYTVESKSDLIHILSDVMEVMGDNLEKPNDDNYLVGEKHNQGSQRMTCRPERH